VALFPQPRGSLSAVLLHELVQPAHRLPPIVLPDSVDPLADEDLQLALHVLYLVQESGFDGIDDRWQWEPSMLAVRSVLEDIFEGGLFAAAGPPDESPDVAADDLDMVMRGVADAEDGPSLSRFMELEGTREQFRELVVQRALAEPREAAPALEALDLEPSAEAHLGIVPGTALAAANLGSMFAAHRARSASLAGHRALGELSGQAAAARCAAGLRRLGLDGAAPYFDARAQAHNGAIEAAVRLVRDEPGRLGMVVWGARASAECDARWARHVLGCFRGGVSSLSAALPSTAPA
jgi:hypothetical protein